METSAAKSAAETSEKQGDPATIGPWVDSLSKSIAAIAIALYASGFLVISLHHSRYGFITTDLLRPRILAAGAWFFVLSAIPAAVAAQLRNLSWLAIARNLLFIWSGFSFLSLSLSSLLFTFENGTMRYSAWMTVGFVLALIAAIVVLNLKKVAPMFGAALSASLVLLAVVFELRRMVIANEFGMSSLTLWFFAVCVVTLIEVKVRSKETFRDAIEWSKPLIPLFGILFIFSQYYYPHIKASWGGGSPVPAMIYFAKDSTVRPNQSVSAQLIEESDQGFYIVAPKETKALFVPRGSISLIYFSDKPDSVLLRDGK